MSVSDAYVMVCCDAPGCCESVEIQLPFTYGGIMHASGNYDHRQETVERLLRKNEWTIRDGQQFCCGCAGSGAIGPQRGG